MIFDNASVYVSSSITFFGRLIFFDGGGGGIRSVSVLLRTRALDMEPCASIVEMGRLRNA